jgi:hypothetical protein
VKKLSKKDLYWFSGLFSALDNAIQSSDHNVYKDSINASGLTLDNIKHLEEYLGKEYMETHIKYMKTQGIIYPDQEEWRDE